jgi:hypothetical protein
VDVIDIDKIIHTINDVNHATVEVTRALIRIWRSDILWTWKWWVSVALAVGPWVIWGFFVKKESKNRLLYSAVMIILISSWFDFLGTSMGLWAYSMPIIPTNPTFLPWDFSLIPVTTMLVLQYKPQINPFIKAIFISALTSYVGEPFFKWIGIYDPKEWRYTYSFIIYMGIYLFAHFISTREKFEKLM